MDISRNGVDRTDDSRDRLWNNETKFSKFYNPSEYLAVDKVIVKFKGKVIFKQYVPKEKKNANVSASKCTNNVTPLVIRMTWVCTWVRTDSGWYNTLQQPMTQ